MKKSVELFVEEMKKWSNDGIPDDFENLTHNLLQQVVKEAYNSVPENEKFFSGVFYQGGQAWKVIWLSKEGLKQTRLMIRFRVRDEFSENIQNLSKFDEAVLVVGFMDNSKRLNDLMQSVKDKRIRIKHASDLEIDDILGLIRPLFSVPETEKKSISTTEEINSTESNEVPKEDKEDNPKVSARFNENLSMKINGPGSPILERRNEIAPLLTEPTDDLCLFLGAGTSMSVGAPGWMNLLAELVMKNLPGNTVDSPGTIQNVIRTVVNHHIRTLPTTISSCLLSMADQTDSIPLSVTDARLISTIRNSASSTDIQKYQKALQDRNHDLGDIVYRGAKTVAESIVNAKRPQSLLDSLSKLLVANALKGGTSHVLTTNYDIYPQMYLYRCPDIDVGIGCFDGWESLQKMQINFYHLHGLIKPSIKQLFPDLDENSIKSQPDKEKFYKFLMDITYGSKISRIILSENTYHDTMLDAYNWSSLKLLEIARSKSIVFIGCSFTDPNVRRVLRIAKDQSGPQHFSLNHVGDGFDHAQYQSARDEIVQKFYTAPWTDLNVVPIWVNSQETIEIVDAMTNRY